MPFVQSFTFVDTLTPFRDTLSRTENTSVATDSTQAATDIATLSTNIARWQTDTTALLAALEARIYELEHKEPDPTAYPLTDDYGMSTFNLTYPNAKYPQPPKLLFYDSQTIAFNFDTSIAKVPSGRGSTSIDIEGGDFNIPVSTGLKLTDYEWASKTLDGTDANGNRITFTATPTINISDQGDEIAVFFYMTCTAVSGTLRNGVQNISTHKWYTSEKISL